jgi:hypothetical protein
MSFLVSLDILQANVNEIHCAINSTGSGAACVHAVSVWSLESLGQQACLLCLEKRQNALSVHGLSADSVLMKLLFSV